MKTLGILSVIFGLMMVIFFISPPEPGAVTRGLVVTSKSGLTAGVGLAILGSIVLQRLQTKAKRSARNDRASTDS